MPKIITGVAGVATADETPSMQVPVPGDLAAAAALELGQQQHLNATATNAARINDATSLLENGVPRVRQVASIAALKALDPGVYGVGSVVFVTGMTSAGGITKGGGLFVLVNESMPETQVPGVPNAYLVVAPGSGSGRWINVSLSVGWASDSLAAQVRREVAVYREASAAGGADSIDVSSGDWVDVPIWVDIPGVKIGDSLDVGFNLQASSIGVSPIKFRLAGATNGGAASGIDSTEWVFQGGTGDLTSVYLQWADDYTAAADYRLSVQVLSAAAAPVLVAKKWGIVARRYSVTL